MLARIFADAGWLRYLLLLVQGFIAADVEHQRSWLRDLYIQGHPLQILPVALLRLTQGCTESEP